MSQPRTGGCLCGAIRYETVGDPVFTLRCHCRDWQRQSGAAHVPAARRSMCRLRPARIWLVFESAPSTLRAGSGRRPTSSCGARSPGIMTKPACRNMMAIGRDDPIPR